MEERGVLVTIGQYWEPSEPLFLKSVLEAHGIEAVIIGEYLGNITGHIGLFGGTPRGGIELRVHAEDLAEAQEILQGGDEIDSEVDGY